MPVANGVVTRHDGCMSLERGTAKLSDLKAAPYNPRKISPAALKGLQASIERFGVVQDIVVNRRSGFVVGGHQRVAALKVAGVKEVPVCWVDLDEPEEKALNVALNNPHISGEFDDSLQALLAEIQDGIGPDLFKHVALDSLLLSEAELGSFSVEETTMPTLDSGDKQPFQQKTFTLHDDQAEDVEAAIAKAKEMGHGDSSVNENSNGNALAFICQSFNRAHG